MSKKTVTVHIKGTFTLPMGRAARDSDNDGGGPFRRPPMRARDIFKSAVDLAIEIPVAPIAATVFHGTTLDSENLGKLVEMIVEAQEED